MEGIGGLAVEVPDDSEVGSGSLRRFLSSDGAAVGVEVEVEGVLIVQDEVAFGHILKAHDIVGLEKGALTVDLQGQGAVVFDIQGDVRSRCREKKALDYGAKTSRF